MKFLIALLIIMSTLIAVLLFTVAMLACSCPTMLAAASNPTIDILCTVAGIIVMLPLLAVIVIVIVRSITSAKKNKEQDDKD